MVPSDHGHVCSMEDVRAHAAEMAQVQTFLQQLTARVSRECEKVEEANERATAVDVEDWDARRLAHNKWAYSLATTIYGIEQESQAIALFAPFAREEQRKALLEENERFWLEQREEYRKLDQEMILEELGLELVSNITYAPGPLDKMVG